ncbi:OsmC family protein [Thioclava kandeliae]|uniref:OsmC family protein n=1 Tax=Thioclava kandeliae TaxID=3070818 RepID=A0ABV1SLY0_9RHOB
MSDITLSATWQGGFDGEGKITGKNLEAGIGIPTEYGGSGAGTDPKTLFTSSTQACFTLTLRAITAKQNIPVQTLAVDTQAKASGEEFAIHHTAKLVLSANATEDDRSAAEAAIARADKVCMIGNLAKKAGVTIDATPEITVDATV